MTNVKLVTRKPQRGYVYGDPGTVDKVSPEKMKKRTFKQREECQAKVEKY